ncbi:MAG: AraC family transcriptional regulator [Chloroflexota bacterium]
MRYQIEKFNTLVRLIEQHSPEEEFNFTRIEGVATYKLSKTQPWTPVVEIPAIVIVGQGQKLCSQGETVHDYSAGNLLVGFYPIPVKMAITEASPENPFLVAGVQINMERVADVLLRMERIDHTATKPVAVEPSSTFSIPLTDRLLDPFVRLFDALNDPNDAAMLGEPIVDEIYYRLFSGGRGHEFRSQLQKRGEVQRISKAVDHIHQNLDQQVSVEELASIVQMSRTAFYQNFKNVMQVSPLQYAKSVKLFEAQRLLKAGRSVNEAGNLVGYNSSTQFSREYKRHFGVAPSATVAKEPHL